MPDATETALERRLDHQMDNPNREALLTLMGEEIEAFREVIVSLLTETGVDTAEGVWLDRVGEIVGITRPGGEEVDRVFRCRASTDPDYDENHGFGNYILATNAADGVDHGDISLGGLLRSSVYGIPSGTSADDETYRDFIHAKIAANHADASIPGIAKYIETGFGVGCTITTGTHVVYIELDGDLDLRQRRFLEYFMPIVAGVECVVTNWPDWET